MEQVVRQEKFEDLDLQIIEENGEEWFSAEDIGKALGMTDPRPTIIRLFNRNRDEFEGLYRVVSLTTWLKTGGQRPYRFTTFNATGAHLLAILARTPKSKALRRWLAKFMAQDLHRLKEHTAQLENRIEQQEEVISQLLGDIPSKLLPAPEPPVYKLKDDDEVRVNFGDLRELVEKGRVSRYPNPTAFLFAALSSQDAPNDPDSRKVIEGVQSLLKLLKRQSG